MAQVFRTYALVLGRRADPVGLRFYTTSLREGLPLAVVVDRMLKSDEFAAFARAGRATKLCADFGLDTEKAARGDVPEAVSVAVAEMIVESCRTDPLALLPLLAEPPYQPDDAAVYRWWAADWEQLAPQGRGSPEAGDLAFALLMPVAAADIALLGETVSSVHAQTHDRVELIVVTEDRLVPAVRARVNGGAKIVSRALRTGLGTALLSAVDASASRFFGIMGANDILFPTALEQIARKLDGAPAARVVYTDEDALDAEGRRHDPQFKVAWDSDRLLAGRDIGRLALYRRDLVAALQGWRDEAGAIREFEFALRASRLVTAADTLHVARVLYHRRDARPARNPLRTLAGAIGGVDRKLGIIDRHVRDIGARATRPKGAPTVRVLYPMPLVPPLVSIVIGIRDRVDLLEPCLDGLLSKTDYDRVEVVVVDNDSAETATHRFLEQASRDSRVRVVPYDGAFNWGAVNNRGVAATRGDVLLLLNNDIEIIHPDWLDELVRQVSRPEVGAVGAKLLYPDGRLQHGGMMLVPSGACTHTMRFAGGDEPGYQGLLEMARTVSAVTGACIALRRSVFEQVGGIEQHDLQVTCSDVDLCLRIAECGHRVIWTPNASLLHKEQATRGSDQAPENIARARREQAWLAMKWSSRMQNDPYCNPNLDLSDTVARLVLSPERLPAAAEQDDRVGG